MIVENPGMLTTVQDLGRYGFQQYGMPVAGAMDNYAMRIANIIVGNDRNAAVLEITFMGFSVRFEDKGIIAITGADLGASLNGRKIEAWQSIEVNSGDKLTFTTMINGCRSYLAVQGGIGVPSIMGSRSTYIRGKIGGYYGRKLLKGDVLESDDLNAVIVTSCIKVPSEFIPQYDNSCVRVILGPQDDAFSQEEIAKFLNSFYQIGKQYDRMGYRLEGPVIKHKESPDIISDGIALGAVQIPGHGQPIIMMADHQTTGGYTKIANVISIDIPYLAQLKPGDRVCFSEISLEEAQELYDEREKKLNKLSEYVEKMTEAMNYLVRVNGREYTVRVWERT